MTLTDAPWEARYRWAAAIGVAYAVQARTGITLPLLALPTTTVRHRGEATSFDAGQCVYTYDVEQEELHEFAHRCLGDESVLSVYDRDGRTKLTVVASAITPLFTALADTPSDELAARWN